MPIPHTNLHVYNTHVYIFGVLYIHVSLNVTPLDIPHLFCFSEELSFGFLVLLKEELTLIPLLLSLTQVLHKYKILLRVNEYYLQNKRRVMQHTQAINDSPADTYISSR